VSVSVLRDVTEKVKPPRALHYDQTLGYPLGVPGDAELQKTIIRAALALLPVAVEEPLILEFAGAPDAPDSGG
jgi:hypothetical protein